MALLTGRSPIETRVIYRPHVLAPLDEYLGLPTLLKLEGYYNVQLSEIAYSDANRRRMRAFDRVNGAFAPYSRLDRLPHWLTAQTWAVVEIANRLFNLNYDVAPLQQPASGPWSAQEKLDALVNELFVHGQPVFGHVHFLETHGGIYSVSKPVFAIGKKQDQEWMPDFYDDSLRELDAQVGKAIETIQRLDSDRPLIIVITSDHGNHWRVDKRIPLAVIAPGLASRRLDENTQPIDIAPTILSLLGVRVPSWMSGRSLISAKRPEPWRPILSAEIRGQIVVDQQWEIAAGTPNGGVGRANIIICDQLLTLDLSSGQYERRKLDGRFVPCPSSMTTPEALLRSLLPFLYSHGYGPLLPPTPGAPMPPGK